LSTPNRLIYEKSPYLLQHAYNPVDWYPWGEEAFTKASDENKPVFLSIGYSTCHWCHVMEHESFEDEEVAEALNKNYISIKVDREERPDIDSAYMRVCQMMTGGGGWPLTIIMTPDKKPFYAATYLPKNTLYGRMGIIETLERLNTIWQTDKKQVERTIGSVLSNLSSMESRIPSNLDENTLNWAYQQLKNSYDPRHRGFHTAPKFPSPHNLLFLLRYWHNTGNSEALEMVEKTLQSMRNGGIYDQVGYGFHRYSTDEHWLVPHFEKMLYDQALLVMAYTEAYQATGKKEYSDVVEEVFTYLQRDMTSPEGAFYSAEDADSEGVEGKFYLWTLEEVNKLLTEEEASIYSKVYNLSSNGNYRDEATREYTGNNIPHIKKNHTQIASELGISVSVLNEKIDSARVKLFNTRENRVRPYKDDKILTSWNGLMIAALAKASTVFGSKYLEFAEKAISFISERMLTEEGRLIRRYRDGEAAIDGFLDDYAYQIWANIELYNASYDINYLKQAISLQSIQDTDFWDEKDGGYYLSGSGSEEILIRSKEAYDGAIPSGNSVSMMNLLRLSRMTGNPEYEERLNRLAEHFSKQLSVAPSSHTYFASALSHQIRPSHELVIVGSPEADDTKTLINALRSKYRPNVVSILKSSEEISELVEYSKHHIALNGKATAYVCHNYQCSLPTTSSEEMEESLDTGI